MSEPEFKRMKGTPSFLNSKETEDLKEQEEQPTSEEEEYQNDFKMSFLPRDTLKIILEMLVETGELSGNQKIYLPKPVTGVDFHPFSYTRDKIEREEMSIFERRRSRWMSLRRVCKQWEEVCWEIRAFVFPMNYDLFRICGGRKYCFDKDFKPFFFKMVKGVKFERLSLRRDLGTMDFLMRNDAFEELRGILDFSFSSKQETNRTEAVMKVAFEEDQMISSDPRFDKIPQILRLVNWKNAGRGVYEVFGMELARKLTRESFNVVKMERRKAIERETGLKYPEEEDEWEGRAREKMEEIDPDTLLPVGYAYRLSTKDERWKKWLEDAFIEAQQQCEGERINAHSSKG